MALPESGKLHFNYYGEDIEASYQITRVLGGSKPDILITDQQGREFDWPLTDAEVDRLTLEELEQGLSDKYREKQKGATS
jgi:hypothetical protein